MAGMYGADVAQLRQLAAALDRAADQLESSRAATVAAVGSSPWRGPDSDRFRHDWRSVQTARLLAAVSLLRDGAAKVRTNADDQERASGVDGHGPSNPLQPLTRERNSSRAPETDTNRAWETLRWIEDLKGRQIPVPGWSVGDLLGVIPLVGPASDLLGAADRIAAGQVPWHEGIDVVAAFARDSGPAGYLVGVNLSLWADVVEQGSKVDWSPQGLQGALKSALTVDGWKEVGHDLMTKLPAMLVGDVL